MQKERRGAPAGLFSIKEQRLDGRFRGDSPGDGTANVNSSYITRKTETYPVTKCYQSSNLIMLDWVI